MPKKALENQVKLEREVFGRMAETRFCIVGMHGIKTSDSPQQRSYDAGQRIHGINRHIAVNADALPHAIDVGQNTKCVGSRQKRRFVYVHAAKRRDCSFDDITEWHPASIRR